MDVLRVVLRDAPPASPREEWVASLRATEDELRAQERTLLADERAPLHPMRVYVELATLLDRDAIVIGDGGDFVSYAGRVIESFAPGCWVDPGPFGCLGSGPGYALAAKLAHPRRQVVLLLDDGAFGFSGMEFDTLARHGVNVVGVMGNNGIWGLEKHPMEFIYGYSVAAELRPETRYDVVVEALGGCGELVRTPAELQPALERAFAAGAPALVNVLTDPSVACHGARASPDPECRKPPPGERAASVMLAPQDGQGYVPCWAVSSGPGGGKDADETAWPGPMSGSVSRTGAPLPVRRLSARARGDLTRTFVRLCAAPGDYNWPRAASRRAAPRRMSCSETSISSRPKASRTSSSIATPATIVGARSG